MKKTYKTTTNVNQYTVKTVYIRKDDLCETNVYPLDDTEGGSLYRERNYKCMARNRHGDIVAQLALGVRPSNIQGRSLKIDCVDMDGLERYDATLGSSNWRYSS